MYTYGYSSTIWADKTDNIASQKNYFKSLKQRIITKQSLIPRLRLVLKENYATN